MSGIRYFPTDRQVIQAVLMAIAVHPLIKNPPVYFPALTADASPEQAIIRKFRDFGGTELSEPGLTLSVYPSVEGDYGVRNSLQFEPYTLGNQQPGEYVEKGRFFLTIELAILDAQFDTPLQLNYQLENPDGYDAQFYTERTFYEDPSFDIQAVLASQETNEPQQIDIEIVISPSETVLRDYMTLLRSIIRDSRTFRPFALRNPQVTKVIYPTTNSIGDNPQNLVFHSALMLVEMELFETNQARIAPGAIGPVRFINATSARPGINGGYGASSFFEHILVRANLITAPSEIVAGGFVT